MKYLKNLLIIKAIIGFLKIKIKGLKRIRKS